MRIIRKAYGFTLVELMITILLSMMITYAIAQVLISSNRSSVTSDGMSQSQETGRFVMSYLANQVRQAGMDSIESNNITAPAFVSCADPNMAALLNFGGIAGNHMCSFESNPGGDLTLASDRLAVAWVPPVPAGGAAQIRDCTGATGYAEDDIILNVFWVELDPVSGMNSLFCQGHKFDGAAIILPSNPKQAIANGVDSMHLLYGEATQALPANNERNVNQYVHGGLPADGGVTNWNQVYAVKVSILTRSLTAVTNEVALRRYVLLDAPTYSLTDAVNRQVFNSTFVVNNYY